MDNLRSIKTYERHCHRYRSQQDRHMSNMFDMVALDITDKGKHKSDCDSHNTSGADEDRTQRPVSKKTKQTEPAAPHSSPMGMVASQWMESSPPSHHRKPTHTVSHCPLFESPHVAKFENPCDDEFERHPKKAKCRKPGRGTKGMKRGARKKGHSAGQHLTARHPAPVASVAAAPAGPSATVLSDTAPDDASSDYPSLETFRDMKEQPFKLGQVHKEMESSFSTTSVSMWDSSSEETAAPTLHRESPFLLPQPWKPSGIKKRSFVKIRTSPTFSLVERAQNITSKLEEGGESSEEDDSSYTSVYTWTTATTTNTGTSAKRTEKTREQCSISSPPWC